jgi:predicted outer membrane repeat protein
MSSLFQGNWADTGGALLLTGTSWVVDCTFEVNTAEHDAGAVAAWSDDVVLLGCQFLGNVAANCPYCGLGDGGGMLCAGDAEVVDVEFSGNHAYNGGAVALHFGSPQLSFCSFIDNSAVMNGGAVYSLTPGEPLLESSTFKGNQAGFGGAIANDHSNPVVRTSTFRNNQVVWRGGAFRNNQASSPVILDCTFYGNSAPASGGAIDNNGNSNPTVVGCRFQGNDSLLGGAMHSHAGSNPVIANCLFIQNTALERGGAVSGYYASPTLANCTMIGNVASIEGGAVFLENLSLATVRNGIIRGNMPDQFAADFGSAFVVTYSNVQGGAVGMGNIDANPLFVDGYHLGPGSPSIDAGGIWGMPMDRIDVDGDGDTCESISIDFAGDRRFQDDQDEENTGCGGRVYVDMGVYETPGSSIHTVRHGDCSDDDVVDVSDLTEVIVAWGPCPGQCCLADFDMDEDVDVDDLQTVILNWDCQP